MKLPLRVECIPAANRDTGEPAWRVIEADGWPVCLCWSEGYAKRIAAAPEMLAALTDCQSVFGHVMMMCGKDPVVEIVAASVAAAIRKATGQD